MRVAIGFSRTNSIMSRLIRLFTKGSISHVYVRYYDKTFKVPLILHSDWGGVQFDLAEKFDMENIAVEEHILDDPKLEEAIRKNLWHLGKGYAYVKLWNWAWIIVLKRWFIRKVKDPVVNPKKLICTDFVLYILKEAGICDIPIGSMTPVDLRQWFEENHERFGWRRIIREKEGKSFLDHIKDFLIGE